MSNTHIVTGCAGFVGSHLCKILLENGDSVIGVDSLVCGFERNMIDFKGDNKFRFINADIRNLKLDDFPDLKYETIWHLAARGELYFCRDNPIKAIDNNVNGTINMLNIASKLKINHFYFADTSAEYDNLEEDKYYPSSENMAPTYNTPLGVYGITKMAASQFVRSYGKNNNFGTTLFRYTNVYGNSMNIERDIPPVVGSFCTALLSNKICKIYGTGEKRRDFIHIDDINSFHLLAFNKRKNKFDTETFNVGCGINYSVNEIYEICYKHCMDINNNNNNLVINKPEQPNEANITLANIKKAELMLGWKPNVDINDGVKRTATSIWKLLNDNN